MGTSGTINPIFTRFLLVLPLYCFESPFGDFEAVGKIKTNPRQDWKNLQQ